MRLADPRSPETGVPILVSGMLAGVPGHGGATWAVLQYVHGLRELGYDPVLVESVPAIEATGPVASYFAHVAGTHGLDGRAALIDAEGGTLGMTRADLLDRASRAVALINLAGTLADAEIFERVPVRIYVDLDPAFTQLWEAVEGIDMRLGGHTHFASVGLDVGQADCDLPTLGRDWIPTLPPVSLRHWPAVESHPAGSWTTVANWRGYGSVTRDGRRYGQKAHTFRPLMELPVLTGGTFDIALSIHPDETTDLDGLRRSGWNLLDPSEAVSTPERYHEFVSRSRAEIGIAKEGYVRSDCGWFSDRSACYLASRRPVLALDTGFPRHLPTGLGLLAFRDLDEAIAGVEGIEREYDRHARAAREIAESHLDARTVIARLLERAGVH